MLIEKKHIPNVEKNPYAGGKPTVIVLHDCGNDKSTFDSEVSYMTNNYASSGIFAQYWVGDGGRIVELADPKYKAAGAGAKANPYAIHIELARTKDIEQFKKDYQAYIWLIRKLSSDFNIPLKLNDGKPGIVTHSYVSYKWGGTSHIDPDGYLLRFGVSLNQVESDIKGGLTVASQSVDKNKVSDWAKSAWEAQTKNGLFDGTRPGEPVTREELAVVITRLEAGAK